MLGEPLDPAAIQVPPLVPFAVKETVLPFAKFPGSDTTLGPEMHSTGEVMGRGQTFAEAYLKSQIAASNGLKPDGSVFIGVRDEDKPAMVPVARILQRVGYTVLATPGTKRVLDAAGLAGIQAVSLDPASPDNLYRHITTGRVALVINTTQPMKRRIEATHFRRLVLTYNIAYCTTVEAAQALVQALDAVGKDRPFTYLPLRDKRGAGARG
jgi:carbamoyl-phosphate synthase large subunit